MLLDTYVPGDMQGNVMEQFDPWKRSSLFCDLWVLSVRFVSRLIWGGGGSRKLVG
jgi:hypothetical protein